MKRFSFRLQRLLHLKQDAEDQQARRLAETRASADEVRRRAEGSAGRRGEAERQMSEIRSAGITAGVLQVAELALRAVRGRSDHDAREFRAAEADVAGEEKKFHAARKERMSLERLRDKQHSVWISEVRRQEQAVIDAIAARRRRRSTGGGA